MHLLAAEGQELPGQARRALRRLDHLLEAGPRGVALVDLRAHQLAVAQDHAQDVVEVVGDASGQAADALELLGLAQHLLRLRLPLLGAPCAP